jgi:hypothetical protein
MKKLIIYLSLVAITGAITYNRAKKPTPKRNIKVETYNEPLFV